MGIDQKQIKQLLQKESPIILEIGAHKGEDTSKFLREFKHIKIFCFEPDPRCIAEFKKMIKDDRCTLIEAAVSNEDGKTVLNLSGGWPVRVPKLLKALGVKRCWTFIVLAYRRIRGVHKEWTGSSSIKTSLSYSRDWPWLTFDKTVVVRTMRLDTWAKENDIGQIDFVWADVQGAERELFGGGANTLRNVKYLYTEFGAKSCYPDALTREETIQLLEQHGFEVIPERSDMKRGGNLLFVNRDLIFG